MAACLCGFKGDWAEFCNTFGFSSWATKIAPCYACWATTANYLHDEAFVVGNTDIWQDFTMDDYVVACESCEINVVVNTPEYFGFVDCYHTREELEGFLGKPKGVSE